MYYEQIIRGQIAAERIERIADACAKANGERRAPRKARRYLLPLAGLEPAGSARAGAARPELQG
jgi:hypothetical protein